MKKFLGICAAGLLVMGMTAQAHADYFGGDQLIRVVYQSDSNGTTEVLTDLGAISATGISPLSAATAGDSLDLASYFTNVGKTGTTYQVAYFGVNQVYKSGVTGYPTQVWTSGAVGATETNASTLWTGARNSLNTIVTNMAATSTQTGSEDMSLTSSYFFKMDSYALANAGSFDGFQPAFDGEIALSASVLSGSQDIFYWQKPATAKWTAVDLGTITTTISGGKLVSSTTATPIPPSVLLLGSGLLGLIGIRRKNVFNF